MGVLRFRHTTKVPPEQTAGQITGLLVQLGADDISTKIEEGRIAGMSFTVQIEGQRLAYRLPIRWRPVYEQMLKEREAARRTSKPLEPEVVANIEAQSRRTAWRIVLEWLKVQMAFVETGARNALEVFMADLIVEKAGDMTLGELVAQKGVRALLAPPEAPEAKSRKRH